MEQSCAILANSGVPPISTKLVKPPKENPNIPTRSAFRLLWSPQEESIQSRTTLTCRGRSIKSLRFPT